MIGPGVVDQDQAWEPVLIEIELDVVNAGSMINFAKDCANSDTEKESGQIQQMSNLDEDQTALKVLAADTYENLIRTNSDDTKYII